MNLTFLKRVGLDLLKFAGAVAGFTPLIQGVEASLPSGVQTVINKGLSELQQFSNVIQTVEAGAAAVTAAGTNIPGPQKAILAAPAIAQVIVASEAMVGRKVKDPVAFQAACVKLAGDWADVQNSIEMV